MDSKLIDLGILKVASLKMKSTKVTPKDVEWARPLSDIDSLLHLTKEDFDKSSIRLLQNFGTSITYLVENIRELNRIYIYPYSYYQPLYTSLEPFIDLMFYVDTNDILNFKTKRR